MKKQKDFILTVQVRFVAADDIDACNKAHQRIPAMDTGGILRNVLVIMDNDGDKVKLQEVRKDGSLRKLDFE